MAFLNYLGRSSSSQMLVRSEFIDRWGGGGGRGGGVGAGDHGLLWDLVEDSGVHSGGSVEQDTEVFPPPCIDAALLLKQGEPSADRSGVTGSPTPYILCLSSSLAFPLQKNVYPPFGPAIEPSSASLVSLRAAMSVWYLPSCVTMRAVLLSGLEETSQFWFQDELSLGLLLSPLPSCEGEQCYPEKGCSDAQWNT